MPALPDFSTNLSHTLTSPSTSLSVCRGRRHRGDLRRHHRPRDDHLRRGLRQIRGIRHHRAILPRRAER